MTDNYLDTSIVECDFCGDRTTLGKAMDDGWYPNHFRMGDEHVPSGGPCCDKCFPKYLRYNENDYEVETHACKVVDTKRAVAILRGVRKVVGATYEAYIALRECNLSERRVLAMLFGGRD